MFTLLFVLWVTVLSSILAFQVNYSTAWNYKAESILLNKVRSYPEALTILKVVSDSLRERKIGVGDNLKIKVRAKEWSVKIEDGESGFNPNELDIEKLKRLLRLCGVHTGVRMDIMIDSFLDWRDKDSYRRFNGAEENYYKQKGYKPRDGSIIDEREIMYIRGFDSETYRCLKNFLNIYGKKGINLISATTLQLKYLGLSDNLIEEIRDIRKKGNVTEEWERIYNTVPSNIKDMIYISKFPQFYKITISVNKLKYIFVINIEENKVLRSYF